MVGNICEICCKLKKACKKNRKTGQLVCNRCYRREFQPKEKCLLCGRIRTVQLRTKKGKPVCNTCYMRAFYQAPEEKCFLCGQARQVKMRKDGNPLCEACYHRENVGICQECGEEKIIQAFGKCYACYQRQRRTKVAIPA